jgi:hypothetical protein
VKYQRLAPGEEEGELTVTGILNFLAGKLYYRENKPIPWVSKREVKFLS